jgi:hypothetical protein
MPNQSAFAVFRHHRRTSLNFKETDLGSAVGRSGPKTASTLSEPRQNDGTRASRTRCALYGMYL